jgi:hypothetical protein
MKKHYELYLCENCLNFFTDKMETEQVFIKTEEEEEKEDVLVHQAQFLPVETPCVESSTESER